MRFGGAPCGRRGITALATGACLVLSAIAPDPAFGAPQPSSSPADGAAAVIAKYRAQIPGLIAEEGVPRRESHDEPDGLAGRWWSRAVRLSYAALAVATLVLVAQLAAWRLIGWGLS